MKRLAALSIALVVALGVFAPNAERADAAPGVATVTIRVETIPVRNYIGVNVPFSATYCKPYPGSTWWSYPKKCFHVRPNWPTPVTHYIAADTVVSKTHKLRIDLNSIYPFTLSGADLINVSCNGTATGIVYNGPEVRFTIKAGQTLNCTFLVLP